MTIPTLPTDNLYKFSALSGMALTLFSIYYELSPIENIVSERLAVETETAILGIKVQATTKLIDEIEEIIDNTIARQNGTYETRPNVLEMTYSNDEIKALIVRMNDAQLENEIDVSKVEAGHDRVAYLLSRQDRAGTNGIIMRLVAWLLLTVGFGLWYWRVQRPLDLLLQDDVMARRSKADNAQPDKGPEIPENP